MATSEQRTKDRAPALEAQSGGSALSVKGLGKRFGDRMAFDDVSFEVAYGEVFGFLGPNGAGKTTTVRTLGTLIAPTAGSATVAGLQLTPENGVEIRRRIAIMPETPGVYDRLSVTENLECFAGLYEAPDPAAQIERALEAVNLTDRANDACGTLSKGLRQRVALARALLSDPQILFLDEPTAGLDPVASRDVHDLIAELGQSGVTIFLTTHRLEEAERLCDRVAILNTTLRTIGRPAELRDRLFAKALTIRTATPLSDPKAVFDHVKGVETWRQGDKPGEYVVSATDTQKAAPDITRALVAADADVLSIGESHHSLEDVYLELIDEDREALARMRRLSRIRITALLRKELRVYRRSSSIILATAVIPAVFLIQPLVEVFATPTSADAVLRRHNELIYLLAIPALVPSFVAAYSIVGERQQGTLEPILTTPIRRRELILSKAVSILLPSIVVSYLVFAVFLALVALFAQAGVSSALIHPSDVLAQVIFTPLIAAWSIWIAMAISVRASDIRVAQQLSVLASLPTVAVTSLIAFNVIHPSTRLVVALAVVLLVGNRLAWRLVSSLFDRERLITSIR